MLGEADRQEYAVTFSFGSRQRISRSRDPSTSISHSAPASSSTVGVRVGDLLGGASVPCVIACA